MAGPNGGGGVLSPQGASTFLQTPYPPYLLGTVLAFKETLFAVPTTPKIQLTLPDPNRVFIEICNNGGLEIFVTTRADGVVQQGFSLNGAGSILILSVSNNGVMPQLPWFAFATAATACTVFEQFYRPQL